MWPCAKWKRAGPYHAGERVGAARVVEIVVADDHDVWDFERLDEARIVLVALGSRA